MSARVGVGVREKGNSLPPQNTGEGNDSIFCPMKIGGEGLRFEFLSPRKMGGGEPYFKAEGGN